MSRRAASMLAGLALLALGARGARGEEPSIADYFNELERLGLIDRATGSLEALAAELERAETQLGAGDPAGAAVRLYAIVESPRFTDFSDSPEYQNAEYDLAVALALSGAYEQALGYLERTLARGPGALYFGAAHRRAVDIALEMRDPGGVLARLEAVKLVEPLPPEATGERAYLRARVAYDKADLDAAESELVRISRKSRLYTASLYLRGVIQTRRGSWKDASEALCEIVDTPDDDRYTFFVDDRYFTLKDLARLGLGRIAHEERRYDDAYYHYFQIPDDSEKLAEALFEAAWSMYQKRELGTARDLVKEFLDGFPDSPLVLEALLLAGYIELADCKFSDAEARFALVVKQLQPIFDVADRIKSSPAKRREFLVAAIARIEERQRAERAGEKVKRATGAEERVLAWLQLDPRFARLHDAAVGLRRQAGQAEQASTWWRLLLRRAATGGGAPKVKPVVEESSPEAEDARAAAELARDVDRLWEQVRREKHETQLAAHDGRLAREDAQARLEELALAEKQLIELAGRVGVASKAADNALAARADPQLGSFLARDLYASVDLANQARALAARLDEELSRLSDTALTRLHTDLRRVLDKAKLGKIDSVIGQKRKLELEIEDLALGRYPPELYGKMYEEGLIGDDEEYWPPEGEFWADEYEGWR